jgi:hypothetical protein
VVLRVDIGGVCCTVRYPWTDRTIDSVTQGAHLTTVSADRLKFRKTHLDREQRASIKPRILHHALRWHDRHNAEMRRGERGQVKDLQSGLAKFNGGVYDLPRLESRHKRYLGHHRSCEQPTRQYCTHALSDKSSYPRWQ